MVCLAGGGVCLEAGGVCLQGEGSAYRGVYLQRGLPIGGSAYRCRRFGRPPEPEKRAVRILLECFLVLCRFATGDNGEHTGQWFVASFRLNAVNLEVSTEIL